MMLSTISSSSLFSSRLLLFLLATIATTPPVSAQWAYRLDPPCGRGAGYTSESVLMCGDVPCPQRPTKEISIKGNGKPKVYPSVMSNSLFQIYDTAGPDLTVDMCMVKEGVVHSASSHALATSCSSSAQYHAKEWYCGSKFTSNSCEFLENQFTTSWECGEQCACGECTDGLASGVTEGHRVLLRYDTPVLNVGDQPWVLGSRSKTSLSEADKKYRNYLEFPEENCHGHTHLLNFARARLCEDSKCQTAVATGHKVSFCVAETFSYGPQSGWGCSGPGDGLSFRCGSVQGLSPGCADLYATYTDGNWIDVTHVPRGRTYFLEVTAGAGCRYKDYDTCITCDDANHLNDQTVCEAETGCVWDTSVGQCTKADWCCMTPGLPDVWPSPQDGPSGRCGVDPKCYLFPEGDLSYYDNNVGVVPVELIDYGTDADGQTHDDPCKCQGTDAPTSSPVCGDGYCSTIECEGTAWGTAESCPSDCCDSPCRQGCPSETGPDGQVIEAYCQDGIDNDGNGLTDCEDPACFMHNERWGCTQNACSDSIDNDMDGKTDCDDEDCFSDEACLTTCINDGAKCTPGSDDTCCNNEEGSRCVCSNPSKQKGCSCQAGVA